MTSDDRRRAIGKVISVSSERFVVELHRGSDNFTVVGFDDVHYVARLGTFVMIPVQSEYVVAEVMGLRETDPFTNKMNRGPSSELDKASSAKFLDLVPIGTLPQRRDGSFKFGVSTFPSLYADALYALDDELDRIFEVAGWEETLEAGVTRFKALSIGTSVVFQGYSLKVRIDDFFGGHVAVLGNTGSGKSCTVATIVQSLFEKGSPLRALGATFVFLDVNGEYRQAFAELPKEISRRYLKITKSGETPGPGDDSEDTAIFRIPHWFMSVEEWELLLRASERTQQPVLRTALGLTTLFSREKSTQYGQLRNHILASCIIAILQNDSTSPSKKDRISALLATFYTAEINLALIKDKIAIKFGEMTDTAGLTTLLQKYVLEDATLPGYAHARFEFESLEGALDLALLYEEAHGNRQIRDYCAQMITRFKWIKEREEFAFLRVDPNSLSSEEQNQDLFVENFLGLERSGGQIRKSRQIIILDMNDVVDEVVEVAASVMARLVFDRLRKAEPRNRLPVNLILEEAHRYVAERPTRHSIDASKIFERIAKEGRKYGMFILVASQRPSELSKTVLSQCSNFVIHRIQNPDDLIHIRQMTPFISESVLKRLPSLPKQHALIFGNAVNVPTTFKVRDVSPRPKSDDSPIRSIWFRTEEQPLEFSYSGGSGNGSSDETLPTDDEEIPDFDDSYYENEPPDSDGEAIPDFNDEDSNSENEPPDPEEW